MNKKNTNTYTVIEDRLNEEVGNAFNALVLAYIIRRANYDKTTKPQIQKTFIMKYLGIGNNNRLLYRILDNLEKDGWFIAKVVSRGKKTTTTVFSLSDKAIKYLNFKGNTAFKNKPEENTDVSEQTTYEQEPQTETVDNHDEQVKNIGMSMMKSDGYAPEPTQVSYTTTPNEKPKKKKKELWQLLKDGTLEERLNAAFEEFHDWVVNVGLNMNKVEQDKYVGNALCCDLPGKYNIPYSLTNDMYIDWRIKNKLYTIKPVEATINNNEEDKDDLPF